MSAHDALYSLHRISKQEQEITYRTYIVAIVVADMNVQHIEVVACDVDSAHSDIRAAYGDDVEIVSTGVL